MASRYIRKPYQTTCDIVRKVRDTPNTFTAVASNITIELRPVGGGTRFFDMTAIRQNLYRARMQTKDTDIKQVDIVRRTGELDLVIERIDARDDIQHLILSEVGRSQ